MTNEGLQQKVPSILHQDWEAIAELPTGGQAAPIHLRHRTSREEAVLKILKPPGNDGKTERSDENRTRLIREIGILRSISHPNIVDLKQSDPKADPPWYVSPFGTPLNNYWEHFRKTNAPKQLFDEAQRIVLGLLDGLKVFHAKGGVHRDIKPQNIIMLDRQGILTPVLIDFGIAYLPDEPRITKTDGDTVANRFVAPAEALYGKLADPPPWWDCLGVMWLWAWMLMEGRGPKFYGRYASDYHAFIPDDRCRLLRSAWKSIEIEGMGPKNATEMISLLKSVGLDRIQNVHREEIDDSFAAARTSWQEGKARHLEEGAQTRKAIDAVAAILGAIYDPIRERISKVCDNARLQDLPVAFQTRTEPSEIIFASHIPKGPEAYLFSIQCGVAPARCFTVKLYASYEQSPEYQEFHNGPVPRLYPFAFTLLLRHDGSAFQDQSIAYWHAANGEIRRYGLAWTILDQDHVFKQVSEWLGNSELWKNTS